MVWLTILIALYMVTGCEQLINGWQMAGARFLTVGVEFTNKEGERARMIHVVTGEEI